MGSGKSTELGRLTKDPEIQERFSVSTLRFEEHEWATLDASQILFRIAEAIYNAHKEVLPKSEDAEWRKKLKELSARIFQPMGIQATDGSLALEFDLVIVKLKQDIKLSEKARSMFRDYGETHQSLLQDFLRALVDDVEDALFKTEGPHELLLIVDDLDKVRVPEAQKGIFDTNLNALLAPPLRIVYTLPAGVLFGESRPGIRQRVEHLYPIRVLKRVSTTFEPESAIHDERLGFFQQLVDHRVSAGVIAPEAIRAAALYSGGVLRDFFHLLREGVNLATFNDMTVLDAVAMRYAIAEARRNESVGLYRPDYEVLEHVHTTKELKSPEDGRYLDLSRIIKYDNGSVWFEANPLLWQLIEERKQGRAERVVN